VSFLLDTVVVSEWTKQRPDSGVVAWLNEADEDRVFVSVVTLAEIRYGIERLDSGRHRTRLETWLRGELTPRFESRILFVDAAVADEWGRLTARSQAAGHRIEAMDALIAATARVHGLTLVTRNERDFAFALGEVLNPWS
jgi:predicted nucleic acid-binding protein